MAAAALAVLLDDGRPVLFRQGRAGLRNAPITVTKLRTMRMHHQSPERIGQVRSDHHMITRVGALLRRTKLDEMPQLWNVLTGEMSLVGPRPTLASQIDSYDWFERRRLEVPPGITGWAQVNGNVELPWEDRIRLDVWYVDHWSFWLDIRTLARTLVTVITGERPDAEALARALEHENRVRRSR